MKKLFLSLILVILANVLFSQEILNVRLSDGEMIKGRLMLPADSNNIPIIVIFVHGTGPNTYLNKRKIGNVEFNYFDLFADEFNKRGIGFFSYNRRGVEIGTNPPYYDEIDSLKYSRYLPSTEAMDVESVISYLRHDKRFGNSKIALLGCSEGTIIASMVADRKVQKIDGLLLFGYANENLSEIIKWQFSGRASIITIGKYFDTNKDNVIDRAEYESTDKIPATVRKQAFQNADFEKMDTTKDNVIDYKDFEIKSYSYYHKLLSMMDSGNNSWIWNNYFRITSNWLKEHFSLEANKTRLLRIDIPIYIFQGVDDASVPVEGTYYIESEFKKSGKTNLKCFIFEGHDHDLNYLKWPFEKKISDGLTKVFDTAALIL
jgi:pimeloyl-ACP methyl ester carboxylesterase